MPLKTFYNLPKHRQREIANICFEEFAKNNFESASLSEMIKKSGVAKGSFYRYFESKEDVYRYLLSLSKEMMETEFKSTMHQKKQGFIDNWVDYIMALSRIEQDYPMLLKFQFKAALESDTNSKIEKNNSKLGYKIGFFKDIIEEHMKMGDVRNDISSDYLSVFMVYMQLGIIGYLQFVSANQKGESEAQQTFSLPENRLKEIVADFKIIIDSGIGKLK